MASDPLMDFALRGMRAQAAVDEIVDSFEPERCRICGCSELKACVDIDAPDGTIRNCAWADPAHSLCDNPDCLAKAEELAK